MFYRVFVASNTSGISKGSADKRVSFATNLCHALDIDDFKVLQKRNLQLEEVILPAIEITCNKHGILVLNGCGVYDNESIEPGSHCVEHA